MGPRRRVHARPREHRFHPLDGARYLRELGAPQRIVDLVAFHSSAWAEAQEFGVADELAEFHDERTLTRDLLWYCDMTTGPDGTDLASRTAWLRCESATAPTTT